MRTKYATMTDQELLSYLRSLSLRDALIEELIARLEKYCEQD